MIPRYIATIYGQTTMFDYTDTIPLPTQLIQEIISITLTVNGVDYNIPLLESRQECPMIS